MAVFPEQAIVEALPADDDVAGNRVDALGLLKLHAALLDEELARRGVRLLAGQQHRSIPEPRVRGSHEEFDISRTGSAARIGERVAVAAVEREREAVRRDVEVTAAGWVADFRVRGQ